MVGMVVEVMMRTVVRSYIQWGCGAGGWGPDPQVLRMPTPMPTPMQALAGAQPSSGTHSGAIAAPDVRVSDELSRLANAVASDRLGRNYLMLPGGGAVAALLALLRRAPLKPPLEERMPADAVAAAVKAAAAAAAAGAAGDGGGDGDGDGGVAGEEEEKEEQEGGGGRSWRDDSCTRQALVALQKLSLKRRAQSQMIRQGAVGWVVDFLQVREGAVGVGVGGGGGLVVGEVRVVRRED